MSKTNPFWTFSLWIYDLPGVKAQCLALQDQHRADVNLILYCLWRASCGERLSATQVRSAADAVQQWRESVVVPVRSLRRSLPEIASQTAVRAALLQAELEAERHQQALLFQLHAEDAAADRGGLDTGPMAFANLAQLAAHTGIDSNAMVPLSELASQALAIVN